MRVRELQIMLLGGGMVGALIYASTRSRTPQPTASKKAGSSRSLVNFTQVKKPYTSKLTGKVGYYTEVVEPIVDLKVAAEKKLGRAISDPAFILATMVASEAGSQHPLAQYGVAHAALNRAKQEKKSLYGLLTPKGTFGSQGFGGRGYAATKNPPTLAHLEVAEKAISGQVADPTNGASQFDSPRVQRKGVEEGWALYTKGPEEVAQDRIKSGMEAVFLTGIDPDTIRFWRKVSRTA